MVSHSTIMGVLVWGLLVLVVFPLLQMPVIIYIAQHVESESDESPFRPYCYEATSRRGQSTQSFESKNESESNEKGESESPEKSEGTTITCPYCGTGNAPDFTYCRDCVRKLPPVGEYRKPMD